MNLWLSAGLACLVATAAGGEALAKSRTRPPAYSVANGPVVASNGHTIEIERRSWLDPGTKVPVGTTNRYMLHQTFYNKDPVQTAQRSWYMQETLPQRPPYNADMIVPYDPGFPIDWWP